MYENIDYNYFPEHTKFIIAISNSMKKYENVTYCKTLDLIEVPHLILVFTQCNKPPTLSLIVYVVRTLHK